MKHQIYAVTFLCFIFIDYSLANCKDKLDKCQLDFFEQLKNTTTNNKNDHQTIFYKICGAGGIYMKFVDCVKQLTEQCKQPLHRDLCNKRGIKISTYRYTWRSNLIHDVCYRTSPLLDQEFFKHEKCISEVLNSKELNCDRNHYDMVKKFSGGEQCEHWKNFRSCVKDEVNKHCGEYVANLSDYLFHTHNSYFSGYLTCNFTGEMATKCWYDSIFSNSRKVVKKPTTTTTTTTTTTSTTTLAPTSLDVAEEDDDDEMFVEKNQDQLFQNDLNQNHSEQMVSNDLAGNDEDAADLPESSSVRGSKIIGERSHQDQHQEMSHGPVYLDSKQQNSGANWNVQSSLSFDILIFFLLFISFTIF